MNFKAFLDQNIVLLDGDMLPGEAAAIAQQCPRAKLHALKPNPIFADLLKALAMEDEPLRNLYRRLRPEPGMIKSYALNQLAQDTGLTQEQVLVGLTAFHQVRLAEFSLEPYAVKLLPPVKCRMDDSEVIRYLRQIQS